jgi:hypothetical protein
MLAKSASSMTAEQLQTKGNEMFKALFNRPEASSLLLDIKYSTVGGSQVTIGATADVKTDFMQMVGFSKLKVGVDSVAKWGSARMRVALALDNTLSMAQSGKMDALKSATQGLLTQLKNAAGKNGDVYVSIVPFNTDVNVNGSVSTIDWSLWDAANGKCSKKDSKGNTIDNQKDCEKKKVGGTWQVDHSKWSGCVIDRDKSPTAYNTMNTTPSGTTALFPANPKDNDTSNACAASVLPQTYDWTALQNKVTAMSPVGMTNTTIGLVHAWQTLTDGAPYSPPAIDTSDGIKTQKIIIFLTDGDNTEDRWSSTFGSPGKVNNKDDIDDRMKAACENAKANNITIFTVLVMQGNESLLKACASPDNVEPKGPKYFKLTSAGQLATTFQEIGTSLTKLRIAQ